jgi:AraC-like DNA-binding protein
MFAHETILSIASRWGLPSAPHFSRLFRVAYGCTPREYRHGAGAREVAAADDAGAVRTR